MCWKALGQEQAQLSSGMNRRAVNSFVVSAGAKAEESTRDAQVGRGDSGGGGGGGRTGQLPCQGLQMCDLGHRCNAKRATADSQLGVHGNPRPCMYSAGKRKRKYSKKEL